MVLKDLYATIGSVAGVLLRQGKTLVTTGSSQHERAEQHRVPGGTLMTAGDRQQHARLANDVMQQ